MLPLALGAATRFIQYLDERLKVYDATIQLGAATSTGDPEGEVVREAPIPDLGEAALPAVDAVLAGFVGPRLQAPPAYSAVKIAGQPMYRYARRGEEVQAPPRPIEILGLTRLDAGPGWLRVEIRCTRGTYARVLADEIAVALGSAGHLRALRRLGSGPFTLDRALGLEGLSQLAAGTSEWQSALRPQRGAERVPWRPRAEVEAGLAPWMWGLEQVMAHLPPQELSPGQAQVARAAGNLPPPPAEVVDGGHYRVLVQGRLLGLGQRHGVRGALSLRADAPPERRR